MVEIDASEGFSINLYVLMLKYGSYWLIIVLVSVSCSTDNRARERPNILLIMCDDLGWGDVGFNGNQLIKTPHLDRLAAGGMILNRFYAACPVCSPTRASCLTGRSPYRMGIPTANAGHLPREEVTIPEILHTIGYRTGHFGKWHLGTLSRDIKDSNRGGNPTHSAHLSIPTEHGYETFFCTEAKVPTWDPMLKPTTFDTLRGESLRYGWSAIDADSASEVFGTYYWDLDGQVLDHLSGANSKIIMDRVLPFLNEAFHSEAPAFATIWFHTPHLPLVTDSSYREKYRSHTLVEQLHYGAISALDDQIGRLISLLEGANQLEQTLIFFCSDNGPEDRTPGSSGPYRERKRSLYEGGVRVPAFAHWPGRISGGGSSDAPMITHDYLPTIAQLVGESPQLPDRPLDGIDLSKHLLENLTTPARALGFKFREARQSWVTDQYKLITTDSGRTYELYDLLQDPGEQADIIGAHPELADELRLDLEKWLESVELSHAGQDY